VFVHEKFNANGIEALPDGKTLIIVNSTTGILYRLDPATGVTTRIPLGTQSVRNGDGILLKDNLLYVVQNTFNRVAVVKLSPDYSSGEIVSQITSPGFGLPTTIAGFSNILYVVNAHFDTTPTQSTEYEVVRVPEWKD
jgi:sugar lactone lactonase YvrE